jgi:hypothetical protein
MDKEESTSARSASTEEHSKEYSDEQHPAGGEEPQTTKSWIHRLNPVSSGQVPPVPAEDAGLVPEMQANFFSKLTWGWMSSLMMVCIPLDFLGRAC